VVFSAPVALSLVAICILDMFDFLSSEQPQTFANDCNTTKKTFSFVLV